MPAGEGAPLDLTETVFELPFPLFGFLNVILDNYMENLHADINVC